MPMTQRYSAQFSTMTHRICSRSQPCLLSMRTTSKSLLVLKQIVREKMELRLTKRTTQAISTSPSRSVKTWPRLSTMQIRSELQSGLSNVLMALRQPTARSLRPSSSLSLRRMLLMRQTEPSLGLVVLQRHHHSTSS